VTLTGALAPPYLSRDDDEAAAPGGGTMTARPVDEGFAELADAYLRRLALWLQPLGREERMTALASRDEQLYLDACDLVLAGSEHSTVLVEMILARAPDDLFPALGEGLISDWIGLRPDRIEWLADRAATDESLQRSLSTVVVNGGSEKARQILAPYVFALSGQSHNPRRKGRLGHAH
jgi:hypothetical protein